MKIQYEGTIDEKVEADMRALEMTGTLKRCKWQGLLCTPIIFIVVYLIIPDTTKIKLVFSILCTLSYVILFLIIYKHTIRKRIRKYIIKLLGSDEVISVEIEFTDENMVFRNKSTDVRLKWDIVEKIFDNDSDIELRMSKGVIMVLPNRIFESVEHRKEWLDFIRYKTAL